MNFRIRASLLGACAVVATGLIAARQPVAAQTERKLTSAQIRSTLVGRVFEYRSTKTPSNDLHKPGEVIWRERADGGWAVFKVFARDDGSIVFFCTTFSRDGQASECKGKVRDVGTWTVDRDRMCTQFTSIRGTTELCYEFYTTGTSIRAKQVGGPRTTMDGESIVLK
jgi:hypothetical protein